MVGPAGLHLYGALGVKKNRHTAPCRYWSGVSANSPGFRPHPRPRGGPVPWQASQTPGETNGFAPAEVRRSAPQAELELAETLLQVGVWIVGETSGVTGRARISHTRIVDQEFEGASRRRSWDRQGTTARERTSAAPAQSKDRPPPHWPTRGAVASIADARSQRGRASPPAWPWRCVHSSRA